jgi:2-dehydro-3-deoxyphosphogluconate aldolase/(4S)-4-hydroxy-2-oxoglutarate aldolase
MSFFDEFECKLVHIGINGKDAAEAEKVAGEFSAIFGLPVKIGNSSVFSGKIIEVMKEPYLGKNGHIAISTPKITEAVEYLKHNGIKFNEQSAKFKPDGSLNAIYLESEIGGFALHFVAAA